MIFSYVVFRSANGTKMLSWWMFSRALIKCVWMYPLPNQATKIDPENQSFSEARNPTINGWNPWKWGGCFAIWYHPFLGLFKSTCRNGLSGRLPDLQEINQGWSTSIARSIRHRLDSGCFQQEFTAWLLAPLESDTTFILSTWQKFMILLISTNQHH